MSKFKKDLSFPASAMQWIPTLHSTLSKTSSTLQTLREWPR
jgi:hypothetical protein